MRCKDCKYWVVETLNNTLGDCHRYPPQLIALGHGVGSFHEETLWPVLRADSWCGEFTKK